MSTKLPPRYPPAFAFDESDVAQEQLTLPYNDFVDALRYSLQGHPRTNAPHSNDSNPPKDPAHYPKSRLGALSRLEVARGTRSPRGEWISEPVVMFVARVHYETLHGGAVVEAIAEGYDIHSPIAAYHDALERALVLHESRREPALEVSASDAEPVDGEPFAQSA